MKSLVLFSLMFVGVVYHSAYAAQPNDMRTATSSQTSTVSIVKTDTVQFVGQNDILLQQRVAGNSPATGLTSICINSASNSTQVTLSTNNAKGFLLSADHNGHPIPYKAELLAAPLSDVPACKHGQHYKLNLSIPEKTYNTALPGNYTDTLTITIAAE